MNTPRDPFSDSFDAIEIDPAKAPSGDAIDRALAYCAPRDADSALTPSAAAPDLEAPGFYLINDADGRFVVDRDTGVVSLRDESVLAREHGQIHNARLRVVETSGHTYTIELALRLTGRVPQMAGSEDLHAAFFAPPAPEAPHMDNDIDAEFIEEDEGYDSTVERLRFMPWVGYNASRGHAKPVLGSEHAPFGTLVEGYIPNFDVGFAGLTIIEDIPRPHGRTAIWSA